MPPADTLKRQQGSALIIALVFLLLLTMIGITAIQNATQQERMAGNARDRAMAFQAAEAALRCGEAWVDGNGGQNRLLAQSTLPLADPASWNGTDAEGPCALGEDSGLHGAPVYHVAQPRLALVNPVAPTQGMRSLYPVTARGVGGSDAAVVVLQSLCEWPCVP